MLTTRPLARLIAIAVSMAVVTTAAAPASATETAEPDVGLTVGVPNADGISSPSSADDTFVIPIDADSGSTLELGLPETDGDPAEGVGGEIVFESDEAGFTIEASTIDVAAEPVLDLGLQVLAVVDDPSAPTVYPFPLDAPEGSQLDARPDGSVELLGTEGEILGIFAAPWAFDADGDVVDTWYEVTDDGLVQHIDHTADGVAHPVLADPAFLVPVAIAVGARIVTAQVVRVAASRAAAAAAARAVTIRAVSSQVATNALRNFATLSFRTGSHTFRLDKSGMTHVLTRHHPSYWTGTNKATQTFFNSRLSVNGVRDLAHQVMRANSTTLQRAGTNARVTVNARIDGVSYRLTIDKGRVVQFFPTGS